MLAGITLRNFAVLFAFAATALAAPSARADEELDSLPATLPAWLAKHVGTGPEQIAPVVLARARALYKDSFERGRIKNACYLAMDATRPHALGNGKAGHRFYVICEDAQSFKAISAGHGSGAKLPSPNIQNGGHCAKNFSNAASSKLSMGGAYTTAEVITSFKGDYLQTDKKETALFRSFVTYDGTGETEDARARQIGGHSSEAVKTDCWKKEPGNSNADKDGLVNIGEYERYPDGRSSGCTNWDPNEAPAMIALLRDAPTTLYMYPESADIAAVAKAVAAKKPSTAYWNAECLKEIGAPRYFAKEDLEPAIVKWLATFPPDTGKKKMCAGNSNPNGTPSTPGNHDEGELD